jgi:hypothetical protein
MYELSGKWKVISDKVKQEFYLAFSFKKIFFIPLEVWILFFS